jgi:hypothetical protein
LSAAGFGQKRTLATQRQWLLLGKADSSKLVNLAIVSGWFRPKADIAVAALEHCLPNPDLGYSLLLSID